MRDLVLTTTPIGTSSASVRYDEPCLAMASIISLQSYSLLNWWHHMCASVQHERLRNVGWEKHVTVSDTKLKQIISRAVIERFKSDHWVQLGLLTGTSDYILKHPRLLRSLRFGDNDYSTHAATTLGRLLDDFDAADLLRMIEEIIDVPAWLRESHPDLHRDVYESEFDETLAQLEHAGLALGATQLPRHIARIRRSIDRDPEQAIGSSKDLLESVLKTILDDHGEIHDEAAELPRLMKQTRRALDLESGRTGTARDRILNALTHIATGVTELRNLHGTGHGRSVTTEPDAAYAHLAMNSSATLARFLIEVHQGKRT
jgi:hypothetical protein